MQAVNVFNERIKRINRVNSEIADWLQVCHCDPTALPPSADASQERRKVEELYAQGLKKLSAKQPPDSRSELG